MGAGQGAGREDRRRDRRLRRHGRRASHHRAGARRLRRAGGDAPGDEVGRHPSRGSRLHQRARHVDAPRRRCRDQRGEGSVRRSGAQADFRFDEIDDGPPAGCCRCVRVCDLRAGAAEQPHPADDQPVHSRSRLRPQLGAQSRGPETVRCGAVQLVRVRGAQRDAGGQEGDMTLRSIAEKVESGDRLTREDGLALFASNDLLTIGRLADLANQRRNGSRVYFAANQHINPTNVCILRNTCVFCSFARMPKEDGAYTRSLEEVFAEADAARDNPTREFHIVGGLHPKLRLSYYVDLFRGLRARHPGVHIKALTAVEVAHLARLERLSVPEVLVALREAGVTSLPGGGAEVFSPAARATIADKKLSGEEWLGVHRAAHRLGIPSNCTMLYGHVETLADRVDHLLALRALQDETGGFLTYIPLAYHPDHNELGEALGRTGTATTGFDDLKNIAVGRLVLDNIPHVKTHWPMVTPFISQVALTFGCDDLEGTVVFERVYHEAGAGTPMWLSYDQIVGLIRGAGKEPVERDSLYQTVRTFEDWVPTDPGREPGVPGVRPRFQCSPPWMPPNETRPHRLYQLFSGLRRDRPGGGARSGGARHGHTRRAERPAGGRGARSERDQRGRVRPQRRPAAAPPRDRDHQRRTGAERGAVQQGSGGRAGRPHGAAHRLVAHRGGAARAVVPRRLARAAAFRAGPGRGARPRRPGPPAARRRAGDRRRGAAARRAARLPPSRGPGRCVEALDRVAVRVRRVGGPARRGPRGSGSRPRGARRAGPPTRSE